MPSMDWFEWKKLNLEEFRQIILDCVLGRDKDDVLMWNVDDKLAYTVSSDYKKVMNISRGDEHDV